MTASSYLVSFIGLLFNILTLAIFGRVLLSWVDPFANMRITQILRDITEPILAPIRSLMPGAMMFDFSPIIATLLLQALGKLLIGALAR
jgi:YggT family protein